MLYFLHKINQRKERNMELFDAFDEEWIAYYNALIEWVLAIPLA